MDPKLKCVDHLRLLSRGKEGNMAFCTNCGREIPEGIKFCANCGAPAGSDENKNTNASVDAMHEQPEGTQQADTGRQPEGGEVPGGDKYGKFIGIGLLILAIVNYAMDPPILTILLSAAIIGGAIVCLAKKYKLKGFPIAAIVLAASCLFMGVTNANEYGMFKTSSKDAIVKDLSGENNHSGNEENVDTATENETEKETSADEGELGNYYVKINHATIGKNYDGERILVVHYDFTNNAEDAEAAAYSVRVQAYQDGIELDNAYVYDEDVYDNSRVIKEIKKGKTMEDCQEAFVLTGEEPVDVEITKRFSLKDDEKVTKTFKVKS